MSNLITLPKKVEAVKPKLKRSELVRVMAARILDRDTTAYRSGLKKPQEREDQIHAEIMKLGRAKCAESLYIGNRNSKNSGAPEYKTTHVDSFQSFTVHVDIGHLVTPELQRKLARIDDERKKLKKEYGWVDHVFRGENMKTALGLARQLLDGRTSDKNAGDRVPQLLADPAMVKAMDSFIDKLENAESDIKSIAV